MADIETDKEESMSFEDILSNLMLAEEIILTIPTIDVDRVKVGLKNLKSRMVKKMKEEGLPIEQAFLEFEIIPSNELDFTDLKVYYAKSTSKGNVLVKKMIVPSDEF